MFICVSASEATSLRQPGRHQQEWRNHPKASHVVYAWRTACPLSGESDEGFSDDGEPGGTAGMPALKVLQHAQCVNLVLLITRYFGGTKLGTGGLQRAYSAAASAALRALDEQSFAPWCRQSGIEIEGPYSAEAEIRRMLSEQKVNIESAEYTHHGIRLRCLVTPEQSAALTNSLPYDIHTRLLE